MAVSNPDALSFASSRLVCLVLTLALLLGLEIATDLMSTLITITHHSIAVGLQPPHVAWACWMALETH